jgi:SAM-dependent methyltransferase
MISNPYDGVPAEIQSVLQPLIGNFEYHKVHERRHARTLQVLLEKFTAGTLLELGTSDVIPIALSRLAPKIEMSVTNFDASQLIDGKITLSAGDDYVTVPAYSLDLESEPLPINDGTLDAVLCCEVVEHMDVDPMYMLAEVNRVLKKDGYLFLTTPNATSTQGIWKILRNIEPYFFMQYHADRSPYRHNYEYSVWSLTKLLDAAGFKVEIWTENSFEDAVLDDIPKLREIGYALPDSLIGDNIFVVARKKGAVTNRHPDPVYVQPPKVKND